MGCAPFVPLGPFGAAGLGSTRGEDLQPLDHVDQPVLDAVEATIEFLLVGLQVVDRHGSSRSAGRE